MRHTAPLLRFASCHPRLLHYAHGLCRNCYQAVWVKRNLEAQRARARNCNRQKRAAGLCGACGLKPSKAYRCEECQAEHREATREKRRAA